MKIGDRVYWAEALQPIGYGFFPFERRSLLVNEAYASTGYVVSFGQLPLPQGEGHEE